MSINREQFEDLVRRTLDSMPPKYQAEAAVRLLIGTYATESIIKGETHLRQLGGGPALGIMQMEPGTFWWLHQEWQTEYKKINSPKELSELNAVVFEDLEYNLRLSIIMARLCYWHKTPEPLPNHNDLRGLATYWKLFYNSPAGAGSVDKFIRDYKRYMKGGEA